MLSNTNILALIGGGPNPKFDSNKVIIWDDLQGKILTELCFYSDVKNVKLLHKQLFVVCENIIFIFNFETFENTDIIHTFLNPKGVISVSGKENNIVCAFPYSMKGFVMVKYCNCFNQRSWIINAHSSSIAYLSLNSDGSLLCTASDKGTIIKIFEANGGNNIQEFRRGINDAIIYSISFDPDSKFVACTSDKKTIHIFKLNSFQNKDKFEEENKEKTQKFLGKFSNFFGNKYLNSECGFAELRLHESQLVCTFSREKLHILYVLSISGKFYEITFDPAKEGSCTIINEKQLDI
jgi:WD40 repeat protein